MTTIEHIERWFREGEHQAEIDLENPQMTACPYPDDTLARRWWTRGYSYQYRIFRALKAEKEIERLRAEVERLTSPRPGPSINSGPGFLTWLNEIADLLPVGTVIRVGVEEMQRWHEAGMTAKGAAEEVARSGQRVRDDITGQ